MNDEAWAVVHVASLAGLVVFLLTSGVCCTNLYMSNNMVVNCKESIS